MKKSIYWFTVFTFIFTLAGCEKDQEENLLVSKERTSFEVLQAELEKVLEQEGIDSHSATKISSENSAVGKAMSPVDNSFNASYKFLSWNKYELHGSFNANWCLVGDNNFRVDYWLWDDDDRKWHSWGTRYGQCISQTSTSGQWTAGDTWVIFYAFIYDQNTGKRLDEEYSNWIFLPNP